MRRYTPPILVNQELLTEYNLIIDKKSKLSRSKRDEIVARVQKLIKEGKVSTR